MEKLIHRNWFGIFGVVAGIAWVLTGAVGIMAAVTVLVLAGFLAYRRCWRDLSILLAAAMLGILSAGFHAGRPGELDRDRRGDFLVHITDANAVGVIPGDEDAVERQVMAEIVDRNDSRKVRLVFPERVPNPGVSSGEFRKITGILRGRALPAEYLLLGADGSRQDVSSCFEHGSFENYLAARDIGAMLTVEQISPPVAEEGAGWLARLRRTLLLRLDRGIDSPRTRAVLGAITLGMRGRLQGAVRNDFQRAGVVHLFSVSGLHVGVLAGLLLLLVCPLGSALHVWVLLSLVGYVWITGGNAPAIRAFSLVVAAEFLRAKALYVRPLEVLGLIGAAMLLVNPFYFADAGFQFSFIITGFLILSVKPAREIALAGRGEAVRLGELEPWQIRFRRWRGTLLAAVFIAASASVSGMALSLYHQSYYFAGAMLTNLMILPVLAPLFVLAGFKMALPGLSALWNPLLELLLGWLEFCIDWSRELSSFNEWMVPGAAGVIAFGILLALALLLRRKRWGTVVLGGVLMYVALLIWTPGSRPAMLVFISGGTLTDPTVAVLEPWSHSMKVWNAGRAGVYPLRNVARHYGISRITELGFGRGSVHVADGFDVLASSFVVEKVRLPEKPVRSRRFRELLAKVPDAERGAKERELVWTGAGNPLTVRWSSAGNGTWQVECGERRLELERTAAVRVHLVELLP